MPSSDLFISEIIEGSSNNKAIEIYNGTGAAIDLAAGGYNIQMFFNGNTTAATTINLTGTIQPGDVFVLVHNLANATIQGQADQISSASWYNGDDAIVLRHGTTVIDAFGQIGTDPGSEWGTGLTSTADNTLRRKTEVTDGDTNGTDSFDPSAQWTGFAQDTFDGLGSHAAGGGTPTASVSINSVSIAEGASGTKELTFTVTRTDTSGAFTVDFATANGTATVADNDYVGLTGTLNFAAGGPATQQVKVVINGDTLPEGNETFTVTLSNLAVTTGAANLGTAVGTGTIQNDDVAFRSISAIQGAGHTSPFVGTEASTAGVVTAIDVGGTSRGFWIQDAAGDGDSATSDAIFVSTGGASPAVMIGQTVRVSGLITEFGSGNNLTVTQITGTAIEVQNGGATGALPTAVVLGAGGRVAPTSVIDDDGLTSYNPNQDAVDFYEAMEGMLVTVPDTLVVGATDSNATWVVADGGVGATGLNARDGITIQADDFNPERINVYWDSGVSPGVSPLAVMGDTLGDVTGVVGYFGGNYEVIATSIGQAPAGQPLPREVTALAGDAEHVTIAAYNLENLDPGDTDAKFTRLALDIIQNLGSPNIIGVEEIQDSNGAATGGDLSGAATLNKLIAKIAALGGPTYQFVEVAPTQANTTGGQENANIRNAFLYDPSKVQYVPGSAELITGAAYDGSRKPLVAEFTFKGETITVIDLHSTSRLGSEQLFGNHQPATNAGDATRIAQSQGVKDYVDGLLAIDPTAKIAVMGDFNGFQFETSLTLLEQGGSLTNLTSLLAPEERYSYVFEGNSQQIDHMLASQGLAGGAQFDIVHMNSGQAATADRATDHDAVLGRFFVNAKPVAVADVAAVNENQNVTIDVLANDTDANVGDTKTLIGVTGGALGGQVSIVGGKVVYSANSDAIDALKQPQTAVDTITYQVQDSHGGVSTGTVSVTVRGIADAPTRTGTANADTMNGTANEDVLNGVGGADKLVGNAGADTLNGGAGNDTLTGGLGADRFVFTGTFGTDVVSDFQANDVIQLDTAQFANFAAVQAAASQSGLDVIIALNAANTITLTGVTVGSLNAGDFLFV